MEFVNKEINDDTTISGKYKTIGEVKNASIRSAIHVISRMHPGVERMHLCKWLFETHYLKKQFRGNLTNRIKIITNKSSYNHIIAHCFDGIDPLTVYETIPILNEKCKRIIQSLHTIDPSGAGTFMDYLVRRLISELRQETFVDTRAGVVLGMRMHTNRMHQQKLREQKLNNLKCYELKEKLKQRGLPVSGLKKVLVTRLSEDMEPADSLKVDITMVNDKQLWQFNGDGEIGRWIVVEEPGLKKIVSIQDGHRFIELERKDEWLKIEYKKIVGWVRYLVPDVQSTSGVSGNIKDYVPNKWFKKIEKDADDNHYCESGCKIKMEQSCWSGTTTEPRECVFPCCQNMCYYMKVQDTTKYETRDILKELYIASCCHAEAFGGCPTQDTVDKIMNILDEVDKNEFISPFICLCEALLTNSNKVLLNPVLGCMYSSSIHIPSDCDLVIDDSLIDIKCTGGRRDVSEMLQLFGYASLLKYNTKYNMRMNNICIINLLQGECKIYNIENILDNNLLEYLHLLTNKYDPNKKINIKKFDNKNIKYPLFVDSLKNNYTTDNIGDNKIMDQLYIEETYENKMENYYPGYKTMCHRQRKQCCPIYEYNDAEGCPFDPMNLNNWDGDQQVGFRD